jgi:hypothetical protein
VCSSDEIRIVTRFPSRSDSVDFALGCVAAGRGGFVLGLVVIALLIYALVNLDEV